MGTYHIIVTWLASFFIMSLSTLRIAFAPPSKLLPTLKIRNSLKSSSLSSSCARAAAAAVLFCVATVGYGVSNTAILPARAAVVCEAEEDEVEEPVNFDVNVSVNPKKENVNLRVVALSGSFPLAWSKDFIRTQGKTIRFNVRNIGSFESIFSQLSSRKSDVTPKSLAAADVVSIGDSWLSFAVKNSLIAPIEERDWFHSLPKKWKIHLRRNCSGEIDPEGRIYAAPYRWGTTVIAYKKSTFDKRGLPPIEDWADLWRPDLSGRIAMVDCPREVIGAVMKRMGRSYNERQIDGEVERNLSTLVKQVLLFDRANYLKAFGVGDAWVVVGWSSDILPMAKRSSNVRVVVPKSGASFWADLWVVPSVAGIEGKKIGRRARGPSPLIDQWIEFCMQPARSLPFQQEVVPGAVPADLEGVSGDVFRNEGPVLDTNLVAGVPPEEILEKCEFLEPLSDAQSSGWKELILKMNMGNHRSDVVS